jgi:hypothetical protein
MRELNSTGWALCDAQEEAEQCSLALYNEKQQVSSLCAGMNMCLATLYAYIYIYICFESIHCDMYTYYTSLLKVESARFARCLTL